jgi:TonB family protein
MGGKAGRWEGIGGVGRRHAHTIEGVRFPLRDAVPRSIAPQLPLQGAAGPFRGTTLARPTLAEKALRHGRYMADTKALFTNRFDAARAAWTSGDEAAAAESLRSAIIAARSDPRLRTELASALFNLGKLSRKFGAAGEAEAEQLLTDALAVSEELFGREGAGLAPMLLELSRLHVQQSQHALARDVLERLLAIAQVKGEEHPDVAAALFDLAFVKRKLGDDASAEALYRDALRIREKVLGPNHMVTVSTVERLSETCAARGNFAEALALLHRALPTREAALGADHERVRAARSRVAQLESQIASVTNRAADVVVAEVAHTEVGNSDVATTELAQGYSALGDAGSSIALVHDDSPVPARRKRTVLYSSAGAATVAIAIVGLMLRPSAGSARNPVSTERNPSQHASTAGTAVMTVPATRTVSAETGATMLARTHADTFRAASVTSTPTPPAPAIQREQRATEKAQPELRAPHVDVHLDSATMPGMPGAPSVDAIMRSTMERQRASDSDRTEPKNEVSRPTPADAESPHTSPKIVGRAPEPAFPDALLRAGRREGQVVVRFMVSELGRVDLASVVVERSDHELFTDAVREVLPRFRFEPAYTRGPISTPIPAWVSVPFRFATKAK